MESFPFTPDQFPPELVHRILLTDEEDLPKIALTGHIQNNSDRPNSSFTTFAKNHCVQNLSNVSVSNSANLNPTLNIADQIGNTMRRAFFDRIYEDIIKKGNFLSMQDMLKDLFKSIRELVPNRTDLHSFLDDDLVRKETLKHNFTSSNVATLLTPVIKAAEALLHLEAPDQNETTSEWLQMATKYLSEPFISYTPSPSSVDIDGTRFAIISTAYIVQKTNFCQMDIQSVHMRQVLVPKLRLNKNSMGILWKQYYFQKECAIPQISSLSQVKGATPHTYTWVQQFLSLSQEFSSFSKKQRIHYVLQKGIVQSIIFSSASTPLHLPEILKFDTQTLSSIRRVAQLSVTGSALALQCCMASKILTISGNGEGLRKTHNFLSRDTIQKERDLLTKAMAKGRGQDGNEMTDMLKEAIFALFDALVCFGSSSSKSSQHRQLDQNQKDLLLQRCEAVLRGEDSVFKLLDKRIRDFFAITILSCADDTSSDISTGTSFSPLHMRTGIASDNLKSVPHNVQKTKQDRIKSSITKSAIDKACLEGFSIYARDLADASWRLKRIGDLMIEVHWDMLLEKLLFDMCHTAS